MVRSSYALSPIYENERNDREDVFTMKMRRKTMLVVMTLLLAYGLQVVYVKSLPSEQITILGYHHIVEDKDKEAYFKGNMWVNSLSSFEAQMKLLKEKGYHSVSLQDVYEWRMGRKELDEKSVVITFDDGFYSSIKYAQPILEKYGFWSDLKKWIRTGRGQRKSRGG